MSWRRVMAVVDPCLPVIFQSGYLAGKLMMIGEIQSLIETDWMHPDRVICLIAMGSHPVNKHTLRADFFKILQTLASGLSG